MRHILTKYEVVTGAGICLMFGIGCVGFIWHGIDLLFILFS